MTTAASVPSIILEGLPDDNDSVPVVASRRGISSTASVATTQLASDVGSVMGRPKIAQLKSVTWYKNDDTTAPLIQFTLQDVKVRRQMKIALGSVRASSPRAGGSFDDDDDEVLSSMIVPGHIVKSIHNRPVKGLSAQAATELWKNPPKEDDGESLRFGSITVMDPEGDEVWVKATIYKPRPDMTLEDLGMTVWYWGYVSRCEAKERNETSKPLNLGAALAWWPAYFFLYSFASSLLKRILFSNIQPSNQEII